jgi:hypothetical protein
MWSAAAVPPLSGPPCAHPPFFWSSHFFLPRAPQDKTA